MKILLTGAMGFAGRNAAANLAAIRDGKNRTRPRLQIEEVFLCTSGTPPEERDAFCRDADFVIHLAGVNRSPDPDAFQRGNVDFTAALLDDLRRHHSKAPVLFASSIQASLSGRFGVTPYGLSKKAAEELLFAYGQETGARVLVYRFPNIVGKWVRPDYNSAVGTFCYRIARDLPISVSDPSVELELLFVDDWMEELLDALEGHEHRCCFDGVTAIPMETGEYCYAPVTHRATLGEIVRLLRVFHDQPRTLLLPRMAPDSLEKKLFSMYLSYLPKERTAIDLAAHADERGSFTEVLKTPDYGQISINVSKPGVTKGEHWHNSKWEIFLVVSGHGLIRERKLGTEEIWEWEVSGDKPQAVYMLPGYTHSIRNLSETENLVTLMWANECFDPSHPDTFSEPV